MVSAVFILTHLLALALFIVLVTSAVANLVPGLLPIADEHWDGPFATIWMGGLLPRDQLRLAAGVAELLTALMSLRKGTRTLSYAAALILFGEGLRANMLESGEDKVKLVVLTATSGVAALLFAMSLFIGGPAGKQKEGGKSA
jgi:hypothetical protein